MIITVTLNASVDRAVRVGRFRRHGVLRARLLHTVPAGKGIWTGIADAYAGIMIILGLSGIFLARGRRGLAGRGGVLMALGILLPVIYAMLMRA